MFKSETELLFPPRLISSLRELRGEDWRELVDDVLQAEPLAVRRLAFIYMMVSLGNCMACSADSYRSLKGCANCAQQAILHFRGSDQDLVSMLDQACVEVEGYLSAIN